VLSDRSAPMKARYRALFALKNIGGTEAINTIAANFADTSALLKHELAYCLGQMQDEQALDVLRNVVRDVKQDVIVRHEAAEALVAIGDPADLSLLEEYSMDDAVELAETCQIAADRIKWLQSSAKTEKIPANQFSTIDPAPPLPEDNTLSIDELRKLLMNENVSLFERYRAMFTLRNINNEKAVLALSEGFKASSALFRHEIAYVFGQIAHQASEPALTATLKDTAEHGMVRHEAAEALGAVATESCMKTLKDYLTDEQQIVRESCEVALDMAEYEMSGDFQYANTVQSLSA